MGDSEGKLTFNANTIIRWPGENATPTAWDGNCQNNSQCGFGYTTSDNSLSGGAPDRFASSTFCGASVEKCWAGFATSTALAAPVAYNNTAVNAASTTITYKISVNQNQAAGAYTGKVYYLCTPNY